MVIVRLCRLASLANNYSEACDKEPSEGDNFSARDTNPIYLITSQIGTVSLRDRRGVSRVHCNSVGSIA